MNADARVLRKLDPCRMAPFSDSSDPVRRVGVRHRYRANISVLWRWVFRSSVVRVWTSKVSNAGFGPRARTFQRDEVEVCIGRRRRTGSSA